MKLGRTTRKWSASIPAMFAILLALIALASSFGGGAALANTPGAVDSTFKANFGSLTSNRTYAVAVKSDGSVLFAGDFAGTFMKVAANGVTDTTFNSNTATGATVNSGRAIAIDSLGRIVVGDNFGGPLNRFSSTGVVDSAFNSAAATATGTSGTGNAVAIYTSDSILVGGDFAGGLKKVSSAGAADSTFNTNAASSVGATVNTIAVQSGGLILVGGSFAGGLKRITSTGLADATFNTNAAAAVGATVNSVAVQPDGSIIVGGSFTGKVKKLNADGTLAANFSTTPNSTVNAVAVQSDGKILVGGLFTGNLTRFNSDLTVDSTFVVLSSELNATVNSIAVKADGKIVVGTESLPSVRQFFGTYVAPGAPLAPVAAASDGQATITVAAGAGVTPTSYTITAVQDNTKFCSVTGASGSCTITGLTNGTPYTFTATAINTVSTSVSPVSPVSNAVTPLSNPIYQSAAVNAAGTELTLTYSKALAATTAPTSAFEVKVAGVTATVTNVAVSGSTVVLTLDPKVGIGQIVTVKYTAPVSSNLTTNNAIQNLAGEDAALLDTTTITNSSTADITPAIYQSSAVSNTGGTVTLSYNEPLGTIAPTANMYAITAGGTAVSVTNVAVSGSTIVLTVSPSIRQNQVVVVNYTAPSPSSTSVSNAAVQDASGNDSISLASQSATNNSLNSASCATNKGAGGVGSNIRANTQGTQGCIIVSYGSTTEEFNYVGAVHTWTVPAGVTSVTFKVYGAGGGATTSGGDLGAVTTYNGGNGGYVESTYSVSPGQSFYLTVGQGGLGNDTTKPLTNFTIQQVRNDATGFGYLWLSAVHGIQVGDTITVSGLTGSFAFFNGTKVTTTSTSGQAVYFASGSTTAIGLANMSGTVTAPQACVGSVMTSPFGSGGAASNTSCANNKNNLFASGGGGSSVFAVAISPRHLLTAGGGGGASLQGAGGNGGGNDSTALSGGNGTAGSGTGTNFGGGATQVAVGTAGGAASPAITGAANGTAGTSKIVSGYGVAAGASSTAGGGGGGGGYFGGGSGGTGGGGGGGSSFASVLDLRAPVLATSGGAVLSSNGTSLVLTFDEAIGATTAAASTFTVYLDGNAVSVSSVVVSGSTVTLNMANAISSDKVVTVSYLAPSFNIETNNAAVQDAFGNDAASFSNVAVTNNSSLGPDRTAPTLAATNAITVSGSQVTVIMNETLLSSALPLASAFGVTINGSVVTPTSLTISGSSVVLALPSSVPNNTAITVTYTAPSADVSLTNSAVQDLNGNDAATFSRVVDLVGPVLASSNGAVLSSNGTSLVLTFDEALGTSSSLATGFTVFVDGAPVTVSSRSLSGSTITLNLASVVNSDKVVTVSYAAPTFDKATSNAAIQDALGNDSVSFTNAAVVNNSAFGPDRIAPVLAANNPVTFSGAQVTVAFNEALQGTLLPDPSRFTVFVAGAPVTPTSLTVSGSSVLLTMPSSITAGTEVIVSYEAPTSNISATNLAIQDTNGNDALSFSQSSNPINKTWNWTTPYNSATNAPLNCDGTGSINRIKETQLPNGVYYSVGVTGDYLCINEATESLAQRGGVPANFTATGLVTEPGLKLTTGNLNCSAGVLCGPRGVMTIYFSKPVKDPVVSFAGWGGGNSSQNSTAWTEMALITPNLTMSVLSGTNIEVVNNGTYIQPIVKNPSISCSTTTGYGATATAGCGSVQLNGTVSSASFEVYLGTARGTGYLDAWNLTASISEDFGLVPTSYDNPVASHSIGDLRLGPTVAADQSSALYATTNADAVASGTSLAGNPKADDGVADWVSSPAINFGNAGSTYSTTVTLAGVTAVANLCSWLDFNRDEVFAYSERFCTTVQSGQTSATLSWTVPQLVVPGLTYARVRLSYDTLTVATGKVSSGEVEDYSMTIVPASVPFALPDSSSGLNSATQNINILANDVTASGVTWVASSVKLCATGQTANNCNATTVTVAGEGTYTVQSDGSVQFVPLASFAGTATPLGYQVTDSIGQIRSSTITPTVIGTPTAFPNSTSGPWNTAQASDVLANDLAPTGYALDATTLKLCDPAASQASPNCNATSVTIANQGTYEIVAGRIQFTPLITFSGTATPIAYQISDSLAQVASSAYTPTVLAPVAPVAVNDASSGLLNTAQTKSVVTNDTSSNPAVILDPTTVLLCSNAQVSPNCTATSVTIANQGTYTVNQTTGVVTFTPVNNWSGTATPVSYQVTANSGQTVTATYTPTVIPAPTVIADTTSGPYNTAQTSNVLLNDSADSATSINASSLKLCDPSTSQVSPNCTATSVTVANQGTYSIVNGQVQFVPLSTFAGTATPVVYQVADALGQVSSTTYTPTVAPPALPVAVSDTKTGPWNTPQTITPLTNDPAGLTVVGLCPTVSTPAASCTATTLTVANEGTYTLVGSTVTFTPLSTFSGTATAIKYAVVDAFAQAVAATITPTVFAPSSPSATPQEKGLLPGTSVSFTDVDSGAGSLATAGSASFSSSCIVDPSNTSSCITSGSFTVANQGTWTINSGVVTFAALANVAPGAQTSVTYRVTDTAGLTASSTLTPIIPAAPTATADTSSGAWNTTQIKNVLTNDTAAEGETLVASTLKLCDPATSQVSPNCTATTLTIANQGTYTVVNGTIQFTPLINFTGTAIPVAYQISDSLGQTASSAYTPTVTAPVAPVAVNDTSSGPLNTAQVKTVLANDTTAAGVTLTATTVKLCDPASSQVSPNCAATSVTIANQGTYTVNQTTGVVTFTPVTGWSGTATPVSYQVTANSGQVVSATYTPTVIPGPTAAADATSGAYNTAQTSNVLSTDSAATETTLVASSLKLCDPATSQTAPNCTATSVTIANQGTYAIVNGQIQFTPLSTFAGTATPVTYQISDALGQTASTTYTPTVAPPAAPIAVNDTKSGAWNTAQTITPLANDPAGLTIVGLCPTTSTAAASCTSTSLTIANEGTYTFVGSTVTFTPLSTFSGVAAPIKYAVVDAFGQYAAATITPTVAAPVAPTATPQTKVLLPGTSVSFTDVDSGVSALATAGTASFTSSCIVDPANPANCISSGSFTVANQGTWAIANGVVTFSAAANITPGTQTAVTYRVTDQAGLTATSSLTPIVPAAPVASTDTSSGAWNTTQIKNVLTNDTAAAGETLVASTLKLCDPATSQVSPNCTATTLTIANQGTYTVVNGTIQFTPLINFTGTAIPVAYQISDSLGQTATSTYTPTVVAPVAPTAVNDTSSGPLNTAQVKTVLSNDTTAAGVTLTATTVKLCDPASSQVPPNCAATAVTIANQGTYTVNQTTGVVTFTPVTGWSGTATPVSYQVTANSGQVVSATYTPTVIPAPTVVADTTSGPYNTVQTSNILLNDAAASGTTLTASTLKLCSAAQTSPNCTATSVTIANQGTYAIVNGQITFTPLSTFAGVATAVSYQVSDALGQTSTTTYTPTVTPPPLPVAVNDTKTGPWNTAQTITPLANDPAGLTIVGLCPTTQTVASSCTLTSVIVYDSLNNPVGTYTLSGTTVTFTPVITFSGTAPAIKYAVADVVGQKVFATITPIVAAPAAPVAAPQTKTLLPSTTTTFTDIDSGATPLATTGSANFTASCIVDPANPANCITSGSFTVANEGTWTINSGVVTFAALSSITPGTKTAVTYKVTDAAGLTATSTLTPIIPLPPVASPDSSAAPQGTVQTLSILSNDTAGGATAPLVPSTVRLCSTATSNASCTLTSLTVAGEGVYSVNTTTGVVTFTPGANYVGIATPIKYVVQDTLGQVATSTISPIVVPPPAVAAVTDTLTLVYGATGTFNPLTNDSAGVTNPIPVGYTSVGSVALSSSTLKLCGVGETYPTCTATTLTTVDGTYVLIGTSITFTPVAGFTGTAVAPPTYIVCNTVSGTWLPAAPNTSCATAQLIPTVTPPANPTATPDTSTNYLNTLQTMTVLSNDNIPAIAVESTLKLCGTNQSAPSCTATTITTADGTYTVVGNTITFMPTNGFLGTAAPVTYVITDQLNHTASSTYTPTVTPVPAPAPAAPVAPAPPTPTPTITPSAMPTVTPKPVAKPDVKTGPINKPITLSPVANDIKANTELIATSIVLCASNCTTTSNTVETKVGIWAVDPTSGSVTFTPIKNWFGRASLNYYIWDAAGNRTKSTLTVIIPKAHIKGDLAYTGVSENTWPVAALAAILIGFGIWLRRRNR